jgi:hypothetical protein
MHLVGDIHQPLHAVSRFTHELPQGDLGGNRVRLCAPPCRLKLHYFWDAALGFGTPAEVLALPRRLPTPARSLTADPGLSATGAAGRAQSSDLGRATTRGAAEYGAGAGNIIVR